MPQRPAEPPRTASVAAPEEALGSDRCPACAWLARDTHEGARDTHEGARVIAASWGTGSGYAERDVSLCLPHLRQVLAEMPRGRVPSGPVIAWTSTLEALAAELREYVRKQDYRHRAEPRGPEQTSWLRAVALVAGMGR